MMLIGRIAKERGPWWSAHCEIVGAFTQGRSRKDARAMLADCIETKVNHPGFKVIVTELAADGVDAYSVFVDAEPLSLLAAEVLKYQRERHQLSLADVAKKLGASSRNAYASYEQGRTEPSISKFRQLLAAVAPELALVVGLRTTGKR
jgi:DNA-binding XRE family transcriptional regulator